MKLVVVIICFVTKASGQSSKNHQSDLLNAIDNSSVLISYNYIESLYLDSLGKAVCSNATPATITVLINNIIIKEKTLICHVLLTKQLELRQNSFRYQYNYSSDTIISTTYSYNNLTWNQKKNGEIVIADDEIEKIDKYWKAKDLTKIVLFKNCD